MKKLIILILICLCISAYKLKEPPKLENRDTGEYLKLLYNKINTLEVLTSTPNGNVKGKYGDMVLLLSGGNFYLEICTSSPNGTVWKGVILTTTP